NLFSSVIFLLSFHIFFFFFFQAEDGIRDFHVTGVQTCALPISAFPKDKPDERIDLVLQSPRADISQEGYDVSTSIDGMVADNGNGWALGGGVGSSHYATF